jgi:hypothetical protein
VLIRSDPPQETIVTPEPGAPGGHADLYMLLLARVLCSQASMQWEN